MALYVTQKCLYELEWHQEETEPNPEQYLETEPKKYQKYQKIPNK